MIRIQRAFATLLAVLLLLSVGSTLANPLATVPAARYEPFYPVAGEGAHAVEPFEIMTLPVTNADFLAFAAKNPSWAQGAPPEVFANPGYLTRWSGPTELGAADPDAPVTYVSWFAASAYCEAQGMRLPSEDEWEVAARAGVDSIDASGDATVRAERLAVYARRAQTIGPVGRSEANLYGLHDLHELVWEWVEDPWSTLAQGDSRNDGDLDISRVCGGASLGARDRSDYPAFLRHAMRTALSPASVAGTVGFRCAR